LKSKETTHKKLNRPNVFVLKTLSIIKDYNFIEHHWFRNSDEWLSEKINELSKLPNRTSNNLSGQQLQRYNILYQDKEKYLLMLLSNMTHFHLGINWFYKSNEFVTDKIAEIIKEFPIISDIVLQTYYQYSA
jgi:hypothetical protein